MLNTITVVTITRRRPRLLERAIASVRAQGNGARPKHKIIVDDCEETRAALARLATGSDDIDVSFRHRSAGEATGPARASKLRNLAVSAIDTEWVAFLDDDNEFHPSHLVELHATAASGGFEAVHSYRELRNADGSPYLAELDPWCEDSTEAKRKYRDLVAAGILTPGSCVMKDRAAGDTAVRAVDTSEWLIRRDLAAAVPFRETYSFEDESRRLTEDDTLLRDLLAAGARIGTNGLATLYYYLGGYSTTFGDASEWRPLGGPAAGRS